MTNYIPILLSDVGRHIIEEINNLTPWDRYELVSELGFRHLDVEWANQMFRNNGEEDTITPDSTFNDPVGDVFDQGLEKEVLEQMDEDDIAEVLVRKNQLPGVIADLTDEQLNKVIRMMSNKNLKRLTDAIINQIDE